MTTPDAKIIGSTFWDLVLRFRAPRCLSVSQGHAWSKKQSTVSTIQPLGIYRDPHFQRSSSWPKKPRLFWRLA
jgi:hypothetical protein